jgi:hypothetical protein
MCGTDRALLPSPYNGLWLPRRSAARYNTAGALEEAIDAISRGTPQFRQPRARSLKCHEIAVRRQRFRAKPVAGNQDPRPPIGRRGPVVRAGAHRLPSEHVQYSRANESRACPFATSHSKALQVSAAKRVRAHTVHTKRCKRLISIVNRTDPSWAQYRARERCASCHIQVQRQPDRITFHCLSPSRFGDLSAHSRGEECGRRLMAPYAHHEQVLAQALPQPRFTRGATRQAAHWRAPG